MYRGKSIALIIPARNEALALPGVLRAVPGKIDRVIVTDNGSTDDTGKIAKGCGAQVVAEPRAGYGRACLAALDALEFTPPDIVAFADGDGSDDLSRLLELLDPLIEGRADFTLAKRIPVEPNALSLQQRFGNWLATRLICLLWGHDYKDLGPMRAITWQALRRLEMSDPNYGWTIEMQLKALRHGLRIVELPLPYLRRRAGRSKVSGKFAGSFKAGAKILWVIGREAGLEKKLSSGKSSPD